MLLADLGSPEELARCIVENFKGMEIPVPLIAIAEAVGITSVTAVPSSFEGVLVTDAGKTTGSISYNEASSEERQRFTIAHEIGHFVIRTHTENAQCARADMGIVKSADPRKAIESQANEFASCLLMPRAHYLSDIRKLGRPETGHILTLHKRYKVSKEAAARRYTRVAEHECAVIFSANGVIRFCCKSDDFPFIVPKSKDPLPEGCMAARARIPAGQMSEWVEVQDDRWFTGRRRNVTLYEQFLQQANGHGLTMLSLEENDDADDGEEEEDIERSWEPRFRR